MHHVLAWRLSLADATETDVTPVADNIWAIQNSHFFPARDWYLQAIHFGAATGTRARLVTPALRQVTTPFIRPIEGTIVPGNQPNVADYRRSPLKLRALEEIQLLGTQTSGGAAVVVATAYVSKGPLEPVPLGDVYTLRGTGTTTLTAGAWSQVTMTWQDILPNGRYAIIGGWAFGATAVAFRCILEDQVDRPGGLGGSDREFGPNAMFDKGGMGIWGTFDSNRMPNIEYFANAADTAQELYLDIVKVG